MAVNQTEHVTAEIASFVKATGSLIPSDFDPAEKWIDTGLLTSLQLVQLVGYVQKTFAIVVSHEDIVPSNFESLQATVDFVITKSRTGHQSVEGEGIWHAKAPSPSSVSAGTLSTPPASGHTCTASNRRRDTPSSPRGAID
jgi:acyl carrier protein